MKQWQLKELDNNRGVSLLPHFDSSIIFSIADYVEMISYLKFFVNNFETIYHLYGVLFIYTYIFYYPAVSPFSHLLIDKNILIKYINFNISSSYLQQYPAPFLPTQLAKEPPLRAALIDLYKIYFLPYILLTYIALYKYAHAYGQMTEILKIQSYMAQDMIHRNRTNKAAITGMITVVPHNHNMTFRNNYRC